MIHYGRRLGGRRVHGDPSLCQRVLAPQEHHSGQAFSATNRPMQIRHFRRGFPTIGIACPEAARADTDSSKPKKRDAPGVVNARIRKRSAVNGWDQKVSSGPKYMRLPWRLRPLSLSCVHPGAGTKPEWTIIRTSRRRLNPRQHSLCPPVYKGRKRRHLSGRIQLLRQIPADTFSGA